MRHQYDFQKKSLNKLSNSKWLLLQILFSVFQQLKLNEKVGGANKKITIMNRNDNKTALAAAHYLFHFNLIKSLQTGAIRSFSASRHYLTCIDVHVALCIYLRLHAYCNISYHLQSNSHMRACIEKIRKCVRQSIRACEQNCKSSKYKYVRVICKHAHGHDCKLERRSRFESCIDNW